MPTGKLPAEGKALWERIHTEAKNGSCKKKGDQKAIEACAAATAWSAIKGAGWHEDANGNWSKKAQLTEFSLTITKASYDKPSGEKRWLASASDVYEDSMGDNMTHELFQDFISRIEADEPPPEDFRSIAWGGGNPYLSVSHYPDLEGKGIAGTSDAVYIDGSFLKAKGRFAESPVGEAAFRAVCEDLYKDERKTATDKVRISIAFLDYGHKHKSNSNVFMRSEETPFCLDCLADWITAAQGEEVQGKEFMKGHLIHLALTRVPANKRTSMEVDKSMTTRKQDAASIVGDELAEELEKEAKLVGKSEAMLVIKADEEEKTTTKMTEAEAELACTDAKTGEVDPDCVAKKLGIPPQKSEIEEEKAKVIVEEATTKKEGDCSHPSSHYLVVEDAAQPSTWHLRVKDCQGNPDHGLMGGAWAALHGGYRGNKYEGPNSGAALSKLTKMYSSEGIPTPKSDAEWKVLIQEALAEMQKSEVEPHPLDIVFAELRANFDEVLRSEGSADEKLQLIQGSYAKVGNTIAEIVQALPISEEQKKETGLVEALTEVMKPIAQRLDLLNAQMSNYKPPVATAPPVPVRRSIPPTIQMQDYLDKVKKSATPKLFSVREIVERTTQ
jgi:hypothetical protein